MQSKTYMGIYSQKNIGNINKKKGIKKSGIKRKKIIDKENDMNWVNQQNTLKKGMQKQGINNFKNISAKEKKMQLITWRKNKFKENSVLKKSKKVLGESDLNKSNLKNTNNSDKSAVKKQSKNIYDTKPMNYNTKQVKSTNMDQLTTLKTKDTVKKDGIKRNVTITRDERGSELKILKGGKNSKIIKKKGNQSDDKVQVNKKDFTKENSKIKKDSKKYTVKKSKAKKSESKKLDSKSKKNSKVKTTKKDFTKKKSDIVDKNDAKKTGKGHSYSKKYTVKKNNSKVKKLESKVTKDSKKYTVKKNNSKVKKLDSKVKKVAGKKNNSKVKKVEGKKLDNKLDILNDKFKKLNNLKKQEQDLIKKVSVLKKDNHKIKKGLENTLKDFKFDNKTTGKKNSQVESKKLGSKVKKLESKIESKKMGKKGIVKSKAVDKKKSNIKVKKVHDIGQELNKITQAISEINRNIDDSIDSKSKRVDQNLDISLHGLSSFLEINDRKEFDKTSSITRFINKRKGMIEKNDDMDLFSKKLLENNDGIMDKDSSQKNLGTFAGRNFSTSQREIHIDESTITQSNKSQNDNNQNIKKSNKKIIKVNPEKSLLPVKSKNTKYISNASKIKTVSVKVIDEVDQTKQFDSIGSFGTSQRTFKWDESGLELPGIGKSIKNIQSEEQLIRDVRNNASPTKSQLMNFSPTKSKSMKQVGNLFGSSSFIEVEPKDVMNKSSFNNDSLDRKVNQDVIKKEESFNNDSPDRKSSFNNDSLDRLDRKGNQYQGMDSIGWLLSNELVEKGNQDYHESFDFIDFKKVKEIDVAGLATADATPNISGDVTPKVQSPSQGSDQKVFSLALGVDLNGSGIEDFSSNSQAYVVNGAIGDSSKIVSDIENLEENSEIVKDLRKDSSEIELNWDRPIKPRIILKEDHGRFEKCWDYFQVINQKKELSRELEELKTELQMLNKQLQDKYWQIYDQVDENFKQKINMTDGPKKVDLVSKLDYLQKLHSDDSKVQELFEQYNDIQHEMQNLNDFNSIILEKERVLEEHVKLAKIISSLIQKDITLERQEQKKQFNLEKMNKKLEWDNMVHLHRKKEYVENQKGKDELAVRIEREHAKKLPELKDEFEKINQVPFPFTFAKHSDYGLGELEENLKVPETPSGNTYLRAAMSKRNILPDEPVFKKKSTESTPVFSNPFGNDFETDQEDLADIGQVQRDDAEIDAEFDKQESVITNEFDNQGDGIPTM